MEFHGIRLVSPWELHLLSSKFVHWVKSHHHQRMAQSPHKSKPKSQLLPSAALAARIEALKILKGAAYHGSFLPSRSRLESTPKILLKTNKHLKYNTTWISNASEQTPSSLPVKGCSPLLGLETWEVDFEGAKTQDGASHQYLYWNHIAFTSFAFNRHFFESRVNNGTKVAWKMLAFRKCPPWHVQVRKGLVARPTGPLVFVAKDDLQWRPHAYFNNGKPSCIKFPDAPQTLWGHWTKSASEILFTLTLQVIPGLPTTEVVGVRIHPGDRSQPAAEFRMFLPAHPAPLTLERTEQWVRGI